MKARLLIFGSWLIATSSHAGGGIAGSVTAGDGKPAINVPISAINARDKQHYSGQTAADGSYSIADMEAGPYIVQASGDDQNYLGRRRVAVVDGQVTSNIDLVGGALALSGTVTEKGNVGVAGAFMTLSKTDFTDKDFLPTAAMRTANTDANGHYKVTGLVPGRYSITLAGPGRGLLLLTNLLVEADTRQDFEFQSSCAIAGKVFGADGKPLEHCGMQAFRVEPAPVIRCFGLVDEDGNYVVKNLGPGTYEVIATMLGYQASVVKKIKVKEGTTNVIEDIAMKSGGGKITGKVTYGKSPLPVIIIAKATDSSLEFMTQANEAGDYTLEGLPAGIYMLNFSDPTGIAVPISVKDGGTVVHDYSYYSVE